MAKLSPYVREKNEELMKTYFMWLCDIVNPDEKGNRYTVLMRQLHDMDFYWTVPNDDNRALDGKMMRDTFAEHNHYDDYGDIDGPCTVLEMLVALAIRCEDEIMYDPDKGNQTLKWFWMMLKNIGLDKCTNEEIGHYWNNNDVNNAVTTWLDRSYKPNGLGGLFPLITPQKDQRKVEFWYQLNIYVMENYDV